MAQRAKGLAQIALGLGILAGMFAYADAPVKHVYMIWDSSCLTKVEIGKDSFIFASMKDDGTPDKAHMKAHGLIVTYDPKCGSIALKTDEELR